MANPDYLSMTPADVIYSADFLDYIAIQAAAERRALATELAGHTSAWQDVALPGYRVFVDAVNDQAQRTYDEVSAAADKLRLAAREYRSTAKHGADMLRYHHG